MRRVLLISSFTADSHVGGLTSAFVLRRLGVEVTWLPTTLFGRHPGWGDPGGAATDIAVLDKMWGAVQDQIRSQGRHFDAVFSGYMGSSDHVALTAKIIDTLKPQTVLVDPVMGDGALYIDEGRAEAICDQLIPRAHICTPNLWEWRYITGSLRDNPPRRPSRLTGAGETLVTSVPPHNEGADATENKIGAQLFIGNLQTGQEDAIEIFHDRFVSVPHGGGDSLAAAYLAYRLQDRPAPEAFELSVSAVFDIMRTANQADLGELPLIRRQDALLAAPILQAAPIRPDDNS